MEELANTEIDGDRLTLQDMRDALSGRAAPETARRVHEVLSDPNSDWRRLHRLVARKHEMMVLGNADRATWKEEVV